MNRMGSAADMSSKSDTRGPVVVAMSGGVDSSVAAALLLEAGHEVIGVTLQLQSCETMPGRARSCCGWDAQTRARAVAGHFGIPHYVLPCASEFEERVLRPAWEEYARGRTPSPCFLCNERVKFGMLLAFARTLGCARIATGHYARVELDGHARPALIRGRDRAKDQSYFLAGLSAEQLRAVIFPLGSWTKPEVRAMAAAMGLPGADAPESQDACLVPEGQSFAEALRIRFHGEARRGKMIADEGQSLGMHEGIHHFTIGQRRGLAVETSGRVWVERIDEATGEVRVTSDEARLYSAIFTVADVAWINDPPRASIDCLVQARYRAATVPCRVEMDERPGTNACAGGHDRVRVLLREPMRAIAPGQAAVFYDGERALGRGWIESVEGTGGK